MKGSCRMRAGNSPVALSQAGYVVQGTRLANSPVEPFSAGMIVQFCSQVPRPVSRIIWLSVIKQPLAGGVGSDLLAVATNFHAAPAPRPLLAGVVEMQHTVPTLPDPISIYMGEQRCHTMRQWREQVFGLMRREPQFGRSLASTCH